jgi:pimeloyl-ACP methyl ester carboxylesterase
MNTIFRKACVAAAIAAFMLAGTAQAKTSKRLNPPLTYKTVKIDGLDIFYREAGDKSKPTILLLHGFPSSSHMFRNLIPQLAGSYHVVAPDYPGYGQSSMPKVTEFDYTYENLAKVVEKFTVALALKKYSLYVQDIGAPIGFRLAVKYPERVQTLIIQNGNAYDEGVSSDFWNPSKAYWKERNEKTEGPIRKFFSIEATKWQYTQGARNPDRISPDAWTLDQAYLDREGNQEISLQLIYDYRSNPPLYPTWQEYFRKYQPPTLIVWGKNDPIFPAAAAEPYKRDLKNLEFHLLDTGHFALEEDADAIAGYINNFLVRQIKRTPVAKTSGK